MINELIGRVFATRDITHRAHWRTMSFSEHMALGIFYLALIEQIDAIVEAHQGFSTLVEPSIILATDPPDLIVWLKSEADWIEVNRDIISVGSNAVANLIDSLSGSYLTTIYKLERLK